MKMKHKKGKKKKKKKTKRKRIGIMILLNDDYACFFTFCWLKENESKLTFLFYSSGERAIVCIIFIPISSSESWTNVNQSFENNLISDFTIVWLTGILK